MGTIGGKEEINVKTTQPLHLIEPPEKVLEHLETIGGGIVTILLMMGVIYRLTKNVSSSLVEECKKNLVNPENVRRDELMTLLNILKMSSGADNVLYVEMDSKLQSLTICDYQHRECSVLSLEEKRDIIEFLREPAEVVIRNKENTILLGDILGDDIIYIVKADIHNLSSDKYILFCYDENVEISNLSELEKVINIVSGKSYLGLIGRIATISKRKRLNNKEINL